jgi:hypothetical protein
LEDEELTKELLKNFKLIVSEVETI